MYLLTKKSTITDWWVARSDEKMAFVNILSGKPINTNDELFVIGYLDKSEKQLGTSSNQVVKVTKKGVTTAKGTFYPFEEAHQLYLQFLIDATKENTLIATNWEYKEDITADIINGENVEANVSFDFIPNGLTKVLLTGYSKKLSANIVFTTFAKRNVCIKLSIPTCVKSDIYISSFATKKERENRIEKVKRIYAEKVS